MQSNPLTKNKKYFVLPPVDESDFKNLFKRMAALGAGRPIEEGGFPAGPWTPELLTDAISQIAANQNGVDLRTVQNWFQDNDKGISVGNIRWLARIFGCGDHDATREWQLALTEANRRLAAKRKARKTKSVTRQVRAPVITPATVNGTSASAAARAPVSALPAPPKRHAGLLHFTEAMFAGQSAFSLPIIVFAGAIALALISYTLNIHSVVIQTPNGQEKQVGFLWAPNWTVVFLLFVPIYLAILVDLLRLWRDDWRETLLANAGSILPKTSWQTRVKAAKFSFWGTFIVTVIVASGYNWVATHLLPLQNGDLGNWPADWSKVAIVKPDVISAPAAIFFTFFVFAYNAFCSYLFFAGLVFLYVVANDCSSIAHAKQAAAEKDRRLSKNVGISVLARTFQCTVLGMLITISMKLQSQFLNSGGSNIMHWLYSDLRSVFTGSTDQVGTSEVGKVVPGDFNSFFCMIAISAVFFVISARLRPVIATDRATPLCRSLRRHFLAINATMLLLVVTYFLIGVLPGFTVALLAALILTGIVTIKLNSRLVTLPLYGAVNGYA